MIPLPTRPRCPLGAAAGVYRRTIMRGSTTDPAFTPSRPPQPISTSAASSNTSMSRPCSPASQTAMSARSGAVRCPAGVLARSRDRDAARASTRPRSAPRRASSAAASSTRSTISRTGTVLGSLLRASYAYRPSRIPSTTACADASPTARSVVSTSSRRAARANAAAASRSAASDGWSPTPVRISAPPSRGRTSVSPTFPPKPHSVSAARSSGTPGGTSPVAVTARPRARPAPAPGDATRTDTSSNSARDGIGSKVIVVLLRWAR